MNEPALPVPADDRPIRVIVEVVSSADVSRLEARDEDIREEVKQLRRENEALRRSFYELLEVFGEIRGNRFTKK